MKSSINQNSVESITNRPDEAEDKVEELQYSDSNK
jgi:hypothetical protein